MKNYIIGFAVGVVATLLALLITQTTRCFTNSYTGSKRIEIGSVAEVQIDTMYIERNIAPIHIAGQGKITKVAAKPSITRSAATMQSYHLKTDFAKNLFGKAEAIPAFMAQLDTIFRDDTISISYDYPQNYFMLSLRPKPDSILFKQIVVRQTPEKWWVKPAIAIGSCALGVLVGCSVK